jgi:hypothetical protein
VIIAATFRLEGPDFDEAVVFWNDCLALAQQRGWSTVESHAEFIADEGTPPASP